MLSSLSIHLSLLFAPNINKTVVWVSYLHITEAVQRPLIIIINCSHPHCGKSYLRNLGISSCASDLDRRLQEKPLSLSSTCFHYSRSQPWLLCFGNRHQHDLNHPHQQHATIRRLCAREVMETLLTLVLTTRLSYPIQPTVIPRQEISSSIAPRNSMLVCDY